MIQKIFHWFAVSSANPQDMALTVKGLLVAASPFMAAAFGLVHLPIDQSALSVIVNAMVNVVADSLTLVGSAMVLVGAVRKVLLSATGRNAVLNAS
jgi:hypothetical protein